MDQFLVKKNIAESESDASDPGNARGLHSGQQLVLPRMEYAVGLMPSGGVN